MSLARALSKAGLCSRTQARMRIVEGRVNVNGKVLADPAARVTLGRDRISVDGAPLVAPERVYLVLNKPRGLVTTASDERGRPTVYACLSGADFPHLSPVGRLDQASEGLLLFTNDTRWADRILSPEAHLKKTYHVQVDGLPDEETMRRMVEGVTEERGDRLAAGSVRLLRRGDRNAWLEITLDEGKNRHIRRLLKAVGFEVRRLVRVSIGSLRLGRLEKGGYRHLTEEERRTLAVSAANSLTAVNRPDA